MPRQALTTSKRYRDFVMERDKALERILARYLDAVDRCADSLFLSIEQVVSHLYPHHAPEYSVAKIAEIDHRITPPFDLATHRMEVLIKRMRRSVYVMAVLGEMEAISRGMGKEHQFHINPSDVAKSVDSEMVSGGLVWPRISLSMGRLKRKVIDAVQLSLTLEDPIADAMARVKATFPRLNHFEGPPKRLKTSRVMQEAEGGTKTRFLNTGFIDPDLWDAAVDDYLEEYDLLDRGPSDRIVFYDVGPENEREYNERYEWEIEREVTEDFVKKVRDGESEAANQAGITDMQWVSVIDGKTDECCVWRDHLTSSEIEAELEGSHADDECDAIMPPAHFNCRCRAVPMTEYMPEAEPLDYGSFEDFITAMDDKYGK
jgi:hypothetical protein